MRSEKMENNNGKVITVHLGLSRNFLREAFNKINPFADECLLILERTNAQVEFPYPLV